MFPSKRSSYMELSGVEDGHFVSIDPKNAWTLSRILTLTGLAATNFFSYTSVFILSSFFPPLAEAKKLNGFQTGIVTGIIEGVFPIAAYLFVQITHVVSPKLQVALGLIVTGLTTILFGFLDMVPDGYAFFGACFVVRVIQGIGITSSDLCVLIIANQVIPQDVLGFVIGITEFSLAAALAVAPAIGGYLFEAGGFYLPFLVSGVAAIVCAVYCYFVFPATGVTEKQSLRRILKHTVSFDMLVYIVQFILGGGFAGLFGGIIEPQLRQFNLTPGQTGLMIFITNAVSGLMFPIWGYITDKLKAATAVTLIGSFLTSSGFVLFGPFPYLPIQPSLPLMCLSLVLTGCGISAILISVYTAAREFLLSKCESEDLANTVLSSSYPSMYSIGAFLGAVLGGTFVDSIGYRDGSAVLFGLQLFGVTMFLILLNKRRRRQSVNFEQ